jgi:hypothetical protein
MCACNVGESVSRDPPVRQQSTLGRLKQNAVYMKVRIACFEGCRVSKEGCVTRTVRHELVSSEVSRGGTRLVDDAKMVCIAMRIATGREGMEGCSIIGQRDGWMERAEFANYQVKIANASRVPWGPAVEGAGWAGSIPSSIIIIDSRSRTRRAGFRHATECLVDPPAALPASLPTDLDTTQS